MELKAVPTETLVKELESRRVVTKIAVGPYRNYRLESKYDSKGSRQIQSDTVLVISPSTL